jgi:hypothetical protein
MSLGPRIGKEVRLMIAGTATTQRNTPRDDLAKELQERIGKLGYPVPDHETLKKMISKARNKLSPGPGDKPWHLGCLSSKDLGIDIPPSAIPAVVYVWKLTLTGAGSPLTIGQAKWVARLHSLETGGPITPLGLYYWAALYDERERASEATGISLDTSDLDAALTMGQWESTTAYLVGKVKTFEWLAGLTTSSLEPMRYRDTSDQDPIDSIPGSHKINAEDPKLWKQLHPSRPLAKQLHSIQEKVKNDLTECRDAPWVYAYWLMHLSKGKKWARLSQEQRNSIMERLGQWVKDNDYFARRRAVFVPVRQMDHYATDARLVPSELLQEAGCEDISQMKR